MPEIKEEEIFYPKNKAEWRSWLEENHKKRQCVWIMYYKKNLINPVLVGVKQ